LSRHRHELLICGSLAYDNIMQYEGRFAEALLADQLHKVNVSFLVPTMRREFGGCAATSPTTSSCWAANPS
jgi:hypothetical protein